MAIGYSQKQGIFCTHATQAQFDMFVALSEWLQVSRLQ